MKLIVVAALTSGIYLAMSNPAIAMRIDPMEADMIAHNCEMRFVDTSWVCDEGGFRECEPIPHCIWGNYEHGYFCYLEAYNFACNF